MNIDPVVEEVRQQGARITQECDGDIHKMAEWLRNKEEQHPHRLVNRRARFKPIRGENPPSQSTNP
ncbi:MAG: hypothetical protein AMXMBFR13_25930 [Phycisphaerae bacterium]